MWIKAERLRLSKGQWNSVRMSVVLNTPGQSNGSVSVTVNGVTEVLQGMVWRSSASVKITSVNFVSFFGGSSADAASSRDTYTMFRNMSLS